MALRFKAVSFLILLGFLFFKPAFAIADELPRAMWMWDYKVMQDSEAAQRLLNFCKQYNINTLFCTAYNVAGTTAEVYRKFNALAHSKGISVHALAGDPRWALEKYHNIYLNWANDILEYNRVVAADEKFDGIHSDVEPYLLGKAWEFDNKNVLIQYLDATGKVSGLIKKSGGAIIFATDIPFWYDDDVSTWVEWHKRLSPVSYHILDTVDEVVVMAYRNFAEGENGSILLGKNEVEYADRTGKKVYIGQETQKNLSPEYITFGGKGLDYMQGQIKKLTDEYSGHPGFKGIAIHHYLSYKKLLIENGKAVE